MPNISSTDGTGRDVIYNGNIITVKAIRDLICNLIGRWQDLLEEGIFRGCRSPFLSITIPSTLVDLPRNTDNGFCFLDLPDNKLQQYRNVLVRHLIEHPDLRDQFFYRSDDKIIGIKPQLRDLMMAEEEMTDIMMVVFHITAGNPARASELIAHLLRNYPGGSIRNFFHLYGLTMMIGGYSKTSNATLKDKVIPRVPPPHIMKMFLYQLIVIRPAMEMFAAITCDAQTVIRYRYLLFPGHQQPKTAETFSQTLAEITQHGLGTALPVSHWRQCAAGLSRLNGNILKMKGGTDYNALQLGHNRSTHDRWYGITDDMLAAASHERIIGCISTSGGWHIMFGLGDDVSKAIEHLSDVQFPSALPSTAINSAPSNLPPVDYALIARMTADHMRDDICHEIRTDMAQFAALYWPKPSNLSSSQQRSLVSHPHRLYALRTFFQNPTTTFRDEKQAYALELIIQREKNVLVVFPTG
jgi:hypothetical protein